MKNATVGTPVNLQVFEREVDQENSVGRNEKLTSRANHNAT